MSALLSGLSHPCSAVLVRPPVRFCPAVSACHGFACCPWPAVVCPRHAADGGSSILPVSGKPRNGIRLPFVDFSLLFSTPLANLRWTCPATPATRNPSSPAPTRVPGLVTLAC